MKLLFISLLFCTASFGAAVLDYSCTDTLGEKPKCTCKGAADCWWMGKAGVCGVVTTCGGDTCTCDWKKKLKLPGFSVHDLVNGGAMIVEMN